MTFYGAFGSKQEARARARSVGGFLRPTVMRGARRYVVMKGRTRNPLVTIQTAAGSPRRDRVYRPSASHEGEGGLGALVWIAIAGFGLWWLAGRSASATTRPRPASVPLTATAQVDLNGNVVGWYLVAADGLSTTVWDAQGNLVSTV